MKVLVAGAGAMGACFGHILSKGGNDVTLCDNWKASVEAVRTNGLKIYDVDHLEDSPLQMFFPEETPDKDYDLVIYFTKSYQLPDMVKATKHLVKDHTKVLCCLNGLGH